MASTICAFCGRYTHMSTQWANVVTVPETGRKLIQGVATCDSCGRASVASNPTFKETSSGRPYDFGVAPDSEFAWHPRAGESPDFPDVPEHIARAAKEAHVAESINSFMSAILMARTVVEASAKAKGVTKGNLVSKIDELETKRIIRTGTKDAAHEIRHFGNDMAHGDIEDIPDADDVRDVLELMDEILSEVFQGPARTARLRNRRAER